MLVPDPKCTDEKGSGPLWCYAIASRFPALRLCCYQSGTDISYAATRNKPAAPSTDAAAPYRSTGKGLRICYAITSTGIVYDATSSMRVLCNIQY
eukprot:2708993-Rhodomonas_salina.2